MKEYLRSGPGRLLSLSAFCFLAGAGIAALVGSSGVLAATTVVAISVATMAVGLSIEEYPAATLLVLVVVPLMILPGFWLVQLSVQQWPNAGFIPLALGLVAGINAAMPNRAAPARHTVANVPRFANRETSTSTRIAA